MFKALDTTTGEEVTILDRIEGERLSTLRARGHSRELICLQCKTSLFVKAGEVYRHHFAHRAEADCPLAQESAELLHARAVLYQFFKSKPKIKVIVEMKPDGLYAPRPIDCWVETDSGRKFAYWIVDRRLKAVERERMPTQYEDAGVKLHWIFLTLRMHRTMKNNALRLGAMERGCLKHSIYDRIYCGRYEEPGRSLYYLDAKQCKLLTFRDMEHCDHMEYVGTELESPLTEMLISPKTGELVHRGEFDRGRALDAARRLYA